MGSILLETGFRLLKEDSGFLLLERAAPLENIDSITVIDIVT